MGSHKRNVEKQRKIVKGKTDLQNDVEIQNIISNIHIHKYIIKNKLPGKNC